MRSDLDENTFRKFADKLTDKENVPLCKKMLDGEELIVPKWKHCLSYEYEICKENYKRTRTLGMRIKAALRSVVKDQEHRTKNR